MIDIGTGDGRFVSAAAKANPNKFYIGVDANTKPLEKPSMKATRKPAKGGLPNAMFAHAAVEDLPEEFDGIADEIHIHFPWGSLLQGVIAGDESILRSLSRIAAPGCTLEIVFGLDPERDATEIARLGLEEFSPEFIRSALIPRYLACGYELLEYGPISPNTDSTIASTWAKKLQTNKERRIFFLSFRAIKKPAEVPTGYKAKSS